MIANHTTGPLDVDANTNDLPFRIFSKTTQGNVGYAYTEADAILFAAAPDLLAALDSARWMLERDFIDPQKMAVIEKCYEAIAKAKGGET